LQLFFKLKKTDVVLLNNDSDRLFKLCVLRYLFPWKRFQLISLDIILRKPLSCKDRLTALIKKFLFKKVDIFVLFFRKTRGYEMHFGISREKIRYIPFKVNSWKEVFADYISDPQQGQYVLCAGRTMRDLDTFAEAVRISGAPALLLSPGAATMKKHGTQLISGVLPANLKLVFHTDGREETFLNYIKKAAVVVVPRFSVDIASTGISTYLCAMAAWRCVIISRGPGAEDVLARDEAIFVTPEDPVELAEAVKKVWSDSELRKKVAVNGRRYAEALQGEERLIEDLMELLQGEHQYSE
jgi:glycosyltransferase involved in cell wall biosynthesis